MHPNSVYNSEIGLISVAKNEKKLRTYKGSIRLVVDFFAKRFFEGVLVEHCCSGEDLRIFFVFVCV